MMLRFLIGILLTVILSACASNSPATRSGVSSDSSRYYVVQPGDNIDSIAFILEMPATLLIRVNPSVNPDYLAAGTRLNVPGTRGTQGEGQSTHSLPNSTFIWPVKSFDMSSPFGYRSGRLHSGIDLRAPRNTAIRASSQGKVVFSGRKNGYGKIIIIAHANGIETAYAHNSRNLVNVGQRVKKGEVIANVGRSGNATGYHVHFEVRRRGKAVDPKRYLPAI